MRKVLALIGLFSILGHGGAAAAQRDEKLAKICVLKVEGMACGACAARVEKEAKKIVGVKAAKVSQPKGAAENTYDPTKTSPEAIANRLSKETGFRTQAPKG